MGTAGRARSETAGDDLKDPELVQEQRRQDNQRRPADVEQDPGGLKRPLRIDADRDTPFQKAIDILDTCKLIGFSDVGLKTKNRKE